MCRLWETLRNLFPEATHSSRATLGGISVWSYWVHVRESIYNRGFSSAWMGVCVRALRCADHVEYSYYACPWKLPEICCYWAAADAVRDPELLPKFKVVLPTCDLCRAKPPITCQPKKAWTTFFKYCMWANCVCILYSVCASFCLHVYLCILCLHAYLCISAYAYLCTSCLCILVTMY